MGLISRVSSRTYRFYYLRSSCPPFSRELLLSVRAKLASPSRQRDTAQTRNVIAWCGSNTPRNIVRPVSAAGLRTTQCSSNFLEWNESAAPEKLRPVTADPKRVSQYQRKDANDNITAHDSSPTRSTAKPAKKTCVEKKSMEALKGAEGRSVTAWGLDQERYRSQQKKFDKLSDRPDFLKKSERRKNVLNFGTEEGDTPNRNTEANRNYTKAQTGSMGDMMRQDIPNKEFFNTQQVQAANMQRLSTPKRVVRCPTSVLQRTRKPQWK